MAIDQEREDLILALDSQRELFRITLRGLDEQQARQRTTVSELTLGGLLHHVVNCERHWTKVIVERDETAKQELAEFEGEYSMAPDDTVAGLLATWDEVAEATAKLIRTEPDLSTSIPTPTTPWTPDRVWWTVRFTLLHVLREITHHSGHADIIREALDGANTTYQRA
ncbi:DinB family protein [Nocardia sp. CA-120079]|uniref:DinB family protein n=1 Tax=Nocardia sp. CA-120079 TaxID=3239974 RepID=UPI003D991762